MFQPPCGVFLLLRFQDICGLPETLVSTPLRGFFVAELRWAYQRINGDVSTPLRGFFVAEFSGRLPNWGVAFQPPCGVFLLLRIARLLHNHSAEVSTPLRGFFVAEHRGGYRVQPCMVSTPLRGFFVAEFKREERRYSLSRFNPLAGFFCC